MIIAATTQFFNILFKYLAEILPFLAAGFLISGLVHTFLPTEWVNRHLGKKGLKSVFYATIVGTILPVCCIGSLPVALSFYKKGAKLGPILAFLVATPATSITALLVTYKLLGFQFAVFLAIAVIFLGLIMGFIGNLFFSNFQIRRESNETCEECGLEKERCICPKGLLAKIKSVLTFAFWEMPKEIWKELLLGLVLATLVVAIIPLGNLVGIYLSGAGGYLFAVLFGLGMYICSTASVPLIHALMTKGINIGAAMTLIIAGPVTSYSALLVLRKIFGPKILFVYLAVVLAGALLAGFIFSLL